MVPCPKPRVLAALKRDGWTQVRQKGSHRQLVKSGQRATFAYHDSRDLGNTQLQDIADDFGYTLDELRRLI